ncbi:MAG TPA: hypothetical protein VGM63_07055 [Mucilaginibacter sp.]|jgi:hypothetical protein
MKLPKPYRRIVRPFQALNVTFFGNSDETAYVFHNRYASDRFEIIRAYHILEKDLISLFEYIEPTDANLSTYSYRIYELLLRAATEFELNCKYILIANNYNSQGHTNITDYFKINAATRLNEYRLFINIWGNGKKEFRPLSDWTNGHALTWYQAYNSVKHNRKNEFARASLNNLILAVGSVFSLVFAQFNYLLFTQYQATSMFEYEPNTHEQSSANGLFSIIPPQTWTDPEMYDFDWNALRTTADPFTDYAF